MLRRHLCLWSSLLYMCICYLSKYLSDDLRVKILKQEKTPVRLFYLRSQPRSYAASVWQVRRVLFIGLQKSKMCAWRFRAWLPVKATAGGHVDRGPVDFLPSCGVLRAGVLRAQRDDRKRGDLFIAYSSSRRSIVQMFLLASTLWWWWPPGLGGWMGGGLRAKAFSNHSPHPTPPKRTIYYILLPPSKRFLPL